MDAMRIDPDNCRDPDLLAGEVRRLQAVIASEQTLTHKERDAVEVALEFCERTDRPLPTSDQLAALRSLLERTLTTHTKPDEGSVQDSDT